MNAAIFAVIAVAAVTLTVFLSLKSKIRCSNCGSINVSPTGEKKYMQEPPLAAFGSPDSYEEIEYICGKCGQKFWKPKKAVIFN